MSINIQKTPLGFKDIFDLILKAQMDYKYFSVRENLNHEKILFLPVSKEFNEDILLIKQELNIPKLNPTTDYILIKNTEIEDSNWLSVQPNQFINEWETQIKKMLNKYQLPISFMDWVEWNILYGKPKTYPHYNLEALQEIINNPQNAEKMSLTTGEKRLFLELLRFVMQATKGKRKNILKKSFTHLEEAIKQSKNQRRKTRTIKTALKAYTKPKFETALDMHVGGSGKYVTEHYTYDRLATEILDVETEEETKKASWRLRKQKQRLLKRHIQPQKVKN